MNRKKGRIKEQEEGVGLPPFVSVISGFPARQRRMIKELMSELGLEVVALERISSRKHEPVR